MLDKLKIYLRQRAANQPEISNSWAFQRNLFTEMGQRGLLCVADPGQAARGSAIIAEETGSLGLAMAWTVQTLVPLALDHLGGLPAEIKTGAQRGEVILALAVSEPGAGAHPKYLRTSAARTQDGWRIDGEKAYLTNGPIASHFAVLAITGEVEQRKAFSFFLVPELAPGVRKINQPQFDDLRPAQHCGLKLEDCQVSGDALIGALDHGYTQIARPFRNLEDGVGAAALIAVLTRAGRVVATAGEISQSHQAALGELAGIETALNALVPAVVASLEKWETEPDAFALRLVAIHDMARRACAILRDVGGEQTAAGWIIRDVEKYLDIARSARQARKARLGQSYYLTAKIDTGKDDAWKN